MARNGKQSPARPRISITQAAASPEEAAAIAAAIEQFLRETAPRARPPENSLSPWLRAGLFEGVGLDAAEAHPWGSSSPV